jgi:hypothetical protein
MADAAVPAWPRPYFKATEQQTKIFFVCFGKAPLAELPLSRARYGLPESEALKQIDVREHQRATNKAWFEGWWNGSFAAVAQRDLGEDLALLTTSDTCFTLGLELSDQSDLSPQQSVWALARWFCERGAHVVLDVHAFHFRTREDVEQLDFSGSDVLRDIKLVLESEPTRDGLHLMHTRGLCKFARPELLCFVEPDDAALVGQAMNRIARTLMEGASPGEIRLELAEGVQLTTTATADAFLLQSLGLEAAVMLARADGTPLAGSARLGPAR